MKKVLKTLLCLLVVLAMVGGLTACGKKDDGGEGAASGEESAGADEDRDEEDEDDGEDGEGGESIAVEFAGEELPPLTLYADETMFFEDEEKAPVLTVRVPVENAFDTIYVLDDAGGIVAEIGKDEPSASAELYREYEVQGKIEKSGTGVVSLTAFMGSENEAGGTETLKSNSLDLYITGHVTYEMMESCSDVGYDLREYLTENELEKLAEEERGDECLAAAKEWLEKDARVLDSEIAGDAVLYHTTDHVLGMYTLPPEEGYLGSSGGEEETEMSINFKDSEEAAEAMANWDKKGYPGELEGDKVYLDGVLSRTNNQFLVLTPYDDTVFDLLSWSANHDVIDSGNNHYEMAKKFREELGYSIKKMGYYESLCCLANGELTDYGIITLMCHGDSLPRSDGTNTVIFCWPGAEDRKDGRDIFRTMAEEAVAKKIVDTEDEFYRYFFHEGTFEADHTLLAIDGGAILIGSNYIMQMYQDQFFDNTIFYTGACEGACDRKFINFCMNHGMQVYVGFKNWVSVVTEPERFDRIFKQLKKVKKNGHTRTIEDSGEIGVITDNLSVTVQHKDWRILGFGNVSGKVETQITDVNIARDGSRTTASQYTEPGKPVTVDFKRFMNQGFANGQAIQTKEDGTFTIDDLEWGVYGVTAQLEGSDPSGKVISGMTLADESFDAGTLELPRESAEVRANVYVADAKGAEVPASAFNVELSPVGDDTAGRTSYTASGKDGAFEIKDIKAGEYALKITAAEGDYTETVLLENGHNYIYEGILLEGDFWFKYINENIVPAKGYASLDPTSKRVGENWNYPSVWDKRSGVVGAQTADFNNDGIEDCVVYYFDNSYVYSAGEALVTNDPKTVLYAQLLTKNSKGEVVEKEKRQIFISDSISFCDGIAGILEVGGVKYVYFEVNTNAYYANGMQVMYTLFTYDGEHFRPAAAVGKTGGGSIELEFGVVVYNDGGEYTGENVTNSGQAWYWADGNYGKEVLSVDSAWNGDRSKVVMQEYDPQGAVMAGLEALTTLPTDQIRLANGPFDFYNSYRNSDAFTEGVYYNCNGKDMGNGARQMEITVVDYTGVRNDYIEDFVN